MKYKGLNTQTMSDEAIWYYTLEPIGDKFPNDLKEFLTECRKEFDKRHIKLVPIMNCKY